MSVGLILSITLLTFTLETAHSRVHGWAKHLQDNLPTEETERQIVKNLIKEIEGIKPLSGKGFFSITRGTLTSMVSVGIIYIIILVQFKISVS